MRDVPEAGQEADATAVLPAAHSFQVTDEAPTTGTASAGSGAGWFGNADDAARRDAGAPGAESRRPGEGPTRADAPGTAERPSPDAIETRLLASPGSADAGRTEVLGGRIGQDRTGREGIPRDRTGPDGIAHDGTAQDRTAQGRMDRDGTQRWRDPAVRGRITWGANQSGPFPGGAKPNRAYPSPTTPSPADPNETDPAGANPGGADFDGPHPTGPAARRTAAPYADRTEVLPPVAPVTPPASPTRAFPTTAPGPATAALRDPWQDTPDADADARAGAAAAADHTHDPHEVTVQLDAVQLGDGVLRRADGPQPGKKGPEGSDGPVFVDASGRRSRLYRRLGIAVGVACAIYAVVIVSTLLSGNSNAPWLPVDGQQEGKPAGQVDTTPLPSQSVLPSETGGAAPGTSPSAGADVTTAPGDDAPAPGTSGDARQPGTSADPDPSRSPAGTRPGGDGAATAPGPSQSSQAPPPASPDPSVPAGDGEPTGEPTGPTTEPTTGTDPGVDTNADGASGPVLAAGPDGPDTTRTPAPLSPENTL
ncbi:hypothetical protein QC281_09495 [Streptomyces sp. DH17]|nr:hypothetical protein [Streptomyces sp. DH17]